MTADVTRLPTRRELKARRSRALHGARLAAASTPEARLLVVVGRARALMAADPADAGQISAGAVEALTRILDAAEMRSIAKVRRRRARTA